MVDAVLHEAVRVFGLEIALDADRNTLMAREFDGRVRFVKVDIEDDEDALADLDVVDFPTLLIAEGDTVHFLGPVLPHAAAARQLVARALRHELAPLRDPALAGLPSRVAALRR